MNINKLQAYECICMYLFIYVGIIKIKSIAFIHSPKKKKLLRFFPKKKKILKKIWIFFPYFRIKTYWKYCNLYEPRVTVYIHRWWLIWLSTYFDGGSSNDNQFKFTLFVEFNTKKKKKIRKKLEKKNQTKQINCNHMHSYVLVVFCFHKLSLKTWHETENNLEECQNECHF